MPTTSPSVTISFPTRGVRRGHVARACRETADQSRPLTGSWSRTTGPKKRRASVRLGRVLHPAAWVLLEPRCPLGPRVPATNPPHFCTPSRSPCKGPASLSTHQRAVGCRTAKPPKSEAVREAAHAGGVQWRAPFGGHHEPFVMPISLPSTEDGFVVRPGLPSQLRAHNGFSSNLGPRPGSRRGPRSAALSSQRRLCLGLSGVAVPFWETCFMAVGGACSPLAIAE